MIELPLVSYICVTNRHSFVFPMLNLFHAQTWPRKELILLDSSEGGRGIDMALSFGDWMAPSPLAPDGGHSTMQYEQVKPKTLVPLKRNLGMEMANGEYMTWMDDDGWHDPERVEHLMLKMDQNECDAIGLQGIYWIDPISGEGPRHYIGTRGFPMSGSMVFNQACAKKYKFPGGRRRASDHDWINRIRKDKVLKHGTINRPDLCVGISHGLNLSNAALPTISKPCDKKLEDFHGDEPYGLKAHAHRIREAVKELS